MSPVDAGEGIAIGALLGITTAACVIPDAWWLAGECFKAQGDPGAIWESGQAWLDSAEQIGEAIDAANKINAGISQVWTGDDADAFQQKTVDYLTQLAAAQVLSYTVGVALIAAAIETFIIILMWAAIAVALLIWMGAIIAASWTVVGAAALEVDAALFVVECEMIVRTADTISKGIDAVLAAGIGLFLVGDIIFNLATGNTKVLGELAVATVEGIGTVAAGMTAKVLQDGFVGKAFNPIGRTNLITLVTGLGEGLQVTGNNPIDILTDPIDPSDRG